MKKLILFFIAVIAIIFSSCVKFKGYCEVCNYSLRSIDSYISQYTKLNGSWHGSHFLGTGSIFGSLNGESYSTGNIFCVIEDNTGTIQIKTIPANRCDIKIIDDSTKRHVIAYRAYKITEDNEDKTRGRWYLSASSIKDIISNNFIGYGINNSNDKKYEIKFSCDTVDYLSNGKASLDDRDSEYEHIHGKYDLSKDCTYYVFYVLEKDIITLSELK